MKISKKRGIVLFVLIFALTCLFVGCNKPDDDDKEEPAQKTVTSVELTKSEASVLLGEVLSLSATVKYSEGSEDSNVIWKTSDEAVATVAAGNVTGVSVGNAVITAAAAENESVSQSCTVSVIKEAELSLNASETTLIMGKGDAKIAAVVKRSNGSIDSNVNWASSADAVVKVKADGTITPVAAGKAEVTASTTDNGKELSAVCKVNVVLDAGSLTNGVAFAQGNEPAGWSSSWAGDNCRAVISYK